MDNLTVEMPWGTEPNMREIARRHTYRLLSKHGVAYTGKESMEELFTLASPYLDRD